VQSTSGAFVSCVHVVRWGLHGSCPHEWGLLLLEPAACAAERVNHESG